MTKQELDHLFALTDCEREPTNGMEKHFLRVVKGEAKPCSPQEITWYVAWREEMDVRSELWERYQDRYEPDESRNWVSNIDDDTKSDILNEAYGDQDDWTRSDEDGWYYED